MKFLKENFKSLSLLATAGVTVFMFTVSALSTAFPTSVSAQVSADMNRHIVHQNIPVNEGYTVPISTEGISHNLSSNGNYTATFKVSVAGTEQNATLPIRVDLHRCKEGNGNHTANGFCNGQIGMDQRTLNLNAGNNYTEFVTVSYQQDPAQACGSFQADMEVPGYGQDIAWSIYRTGMDCPQPTPTPTPTPTATPTPTPTPTATPTPTPEPSHTPKPTPTPMPSGQCPIGHVQKVENSTIVCVAQNQEQNQSQVQNNNQNQDVNQNVVATGGSSSSSSSSSSHVNININ